MYSFKKKKHNSYDLSVWDNSCKFECSLLILLFLFYIIIFWLAKFKMEVIKINSVKNKTNFLYTLQFNRL